MATPDQRPEKQQPPIRQKQPPPGIQPVETPGLLQRCASRCQPSAQSLPAAAGPSEHAKRQNRGQAARKAGKETSERAWGETDSHCKDNPEKPPLKHRNEPEKTSRNCWMPKGPIHSSTPKITIPAPGRHAPSAPAPGSSFSAFGKRQHLAESSPDRGVYADARINHAFPRTTDHAP